MCRTSAWNSDPAEFLSTWQILEHIMRPSILKTVLNDAADTLNYYENHFVNKVVFKKFASYSVILLTHRKPDSYSALASSLV